MKGYLAVTVIVAVVLLALPPLVISTSPSGQAVSGDVSDTFTVQTDDGTTEAGVDAAALVRYATALSLPADAPAEAIKATAVAWYSLFCYERAHNANGVVTSAPEYPAAYTDAYWQTKWGEVYEQTAAHFSAACKAVNGKILLYAGEPIMALTHGMNSGKTEAYQTLWEQEVPYLQGVDSAWDAADPTHLTTVTLSAEEATPTIKALAQIDTLGESTAWFSDAVVSEAGTVKEIRVCETVVSGTDVAAAFSLPSAAFTVAVQEERVIFTVQGEGHFVGMSLCGAVAMANEGKTWQEIARHYYTGIETT